MAIDLIPEEERGRANGFMFGGQALGMAIGTSMTGFALAIGGMSLAGLLTALVVAAPHSLIVMLRKRPGERLFSWSKGVPFAHALELHAGAWLSAMLIAMALANLGSLVLTMVARVGR